LLKKVHYLLCQDWIRNNTSVDEWIVSSNGTYTPTGGSAGNYAITNNNNCLPDLICAYLSHLETGYGRMVNLIPSK
jgi:hypothetical protein